MKKILFFAVMALALVACTKDEPDSDARAKFVGDYNLVVKATIYPSCDNSTIDGYLPESKDLTTKVLDLKIEKDSTSDNQVIVSGFYNCKGMVSGNNLILESSIGKEYFDLADLIDTDNELIKSLVKDIEIPFEFTVVHQIATLDGNTLTWHCDGAGDYTLSLGTFGNITFHGDISAENTATKK